MVLLMPLICCHGDVTSQVSTINEVLLIGSYQYDSQIKDFVYRMMKEYNLQVRSVMLYIVLYIISTVMN